MSSEITWFEEIGLKDRPRVGGKGASLGELTRAGLRVPRGFVVTTAAYRAFVAHCDPYGELRSRIAALGANDGDAAELAGIRAHLQSAPLPASFAASLNSAYRTLCTNASLATDPVAVRSSATSEDSAAASFAGLQDTFLWVRGDDKIAAALRRCWSSLFSDPAVAYRRKLGIDEDDMAMAVVIQRMVEPATAGVMFTRSPLTGDPSVIAISASWGLGSTVVGGEVTPDEFLMNKITGAVQRSTISCKEVQHVPNEAGSGTHAEPIPADRQNEPSLREHQLRALTEIARRIEKHYGAAQDIEWAIDADEAVYVLQSRPETVWSVRDREAAERRASEATPTTPYSHVLSFFTPRK